ncbi:MAG: phosphotransferase, partial [Pseudomonadota bacterium]
MPQRLEQLENWLRARCGLVQFSIAPASGDASFRRYFRVRVPGEVSRIAMDAPPDREDCRPFVDIGSRLAGAGLHVPAVYAADLEQGFLLLEDLGDRQYLPRLGEGSEQRLYGDALAALMAMQACVSPEGLPPYDRGLLMMEMELFRHWLCGRHLGLAL